MEAKPARPFGASEGAGVGEGNKPLDQLGDLASADRRRAQRVRMRLVRLLCAASAHLLDAVCHAPWLPRAPGHFTPEYVGMKLQGVAEQP